MVSLLVVAVFLLQPPPAAAFKILPTNGSLTHQQITEAAFLRKPLPGGKTLRYL
ncbi:hypothetical protein M9458_001431, partial [Cirrhinus mrigala]